MSLTGYASCAATIEDELEGDSADGLLVLIYRRGGRLWGAKVVCEDGSLSRGEVSLGTSPAD